MFKPAVTVESGVFFAHTIWWAITNHKKTRCPRFHYAKYVCASEENGLTCWNTETGHGAFMNRDGVDNI